MTNGAPTTAWDSIDLVVDYQPHRCRSRQVLGCSPPVSSRIDNAATSTSGIHAMAAPRCKNRMSEKRAFS